MNDDLLDHELDRLETTIRATKQGLQEIQIQIQEGHHLLDSMPAQMEDVTHLLRGNMAMVLNMERRTSVWPALLGFACVFLVLLYFVL